MRKFLAIAALLVLTVPAFAVLGPQRSHLYTTSSNVVKIPIETIVSGANHSVPNRIAFVGCTDDNFQVLAWKYDGTSFNLVYPAVADTSSAGALAGQYVRVEGKFDFLVVKSENIAAVDVSFQLYDKFD